MNKSIDITGVVLNTDRLVLRPWNLEDVDDFYEYASVPGVGEMAGWSHHRSKEESLAILSIFIEGKRIFAIELDGKVIGSIGIELYDEKAFPEFDNMNGREIGFVLSKDYWGQGIMVEAVNRIVEYLFDEVGLDFIICGHFIENNQSKSVQNKCGFKQYKPYTYTTKWGEKKEGIASVLYR